MKMINKPGSVFRTYSFWGMASGLMMLAQEIVPLWEGVVKDGTFTIMGAAALTLGIIGRFINQGIAAEQARDD